ncbi:MAG TPA: hypothetical protein VK988_09855 [Acidimicrobiales bacterium]|nr:hypothetical protein [Acidimicrobiales bacterium]
MVKVVDPSPSSSWALTYRLRSVVESQAEAALEVELEAKLNVLAFDENSAHKKVERALGAGRNVGADVESTGVVWTYAATPQAEPHS